MIKNLYVNHNLNMSSKIPKKPRLKESKTKVESVTMKSYRHRLPVDYLDDVIMPLYKYSFKGYGVNNCFFNTMTNLANGTNTKTDPGYAGDWSSFACLPGRQCYMEFNALPLFDISKVSGVTNGSGAANFKTTASIAKLISNCLKANPVPFKNYLYQYENFETNTSGSFENLFTDVLLYDRFANLDALNADRRLNTTFYYEGGYQVHKFYNTTSMPVYVEVREFRPKNPLSYTLHRGDFETGGSPVNTASFPGMFETMSNDLTALRADTSAPAFAPASRNNTGPDQLWNELDDKGFKYNRYMSETNQRWIVGEKVTHRVDPGETFTYKMVLPPFTLKIKDIYQYLNYYINHVSGSVGSFSTASNSNFVPAFLPAYSKFCSIRMTGSIGFLHPNPAVADTDSFANSFAYPSLTSDTVTANNGPLRGTATHSVRMTHEVTEVHNCRALGTYDKFHQDVFNYLPNASDKTDITTADRLSFIDPTSNDQEHPAGDTAI